MQRIPAANDRFDEPDDREPEDGDARLASVPPTRDDDEAAEDREHGVARRINPLPIREDEEEELSEADIMEELDDDDLKKMEGPDA